MGCIRIERGLLFFVLAVFTVAVFAILFFFEAKFLHYHFSKTNKG
jgi:hypothetical protein